MSEKTLTKADIVDIIYEKMDKNRNEVKGLVESLLRLSKQSIRKDYFLLVSGLGKFEAYAKKARKGRNPQTDATITLPPRKVVVFRLSRKFRAELNNGDGGDNDEFQAGLDDGDGVGNDEFQAGLYNSDGGDNGEFQDELNAGDGGADHDEGGKRE